MMRWATSHTASIAPTISCLPTTTSSSRHSSCAVTPGSTRAGRGGTQEARTHTAIRKDGRRARLPGDRRSRGHRGGLTCCTRIGAVPTPCWARMPGQYSTPCGCRPCRPEPASARSARLFLCARCRAQVLVCSCCDRGQIYCTGGCAQIARREGLREAGQRYQASRRGRVAHALRAHRYRARQKNVTPYNALASVNQHPRVGIVNARREIRRTPGNPTAETDSVAEEADRYNRSQGQIP
jgi:hypothetical protein